MEDLGKKEPRFRYMMLDRMRQDCDYYLRINCGANCLWAKDEKSQIKNMKALWNSFPERDKPEWLTMEQIEEYERKLLK